MQKSQGSCEKGNLRLPGGLRAPRQHREHWSHWQTHCKCVRCVDLQSGSVDSRIEAVYLDKGPLKLTSHSRNSHSPSGLSNKYSSNPKLQDCITADVLLRKHTYRACTASNPITCGATIEEAAVLSTQASVFPVEDGSRLSIDATADRADRVEGAVRRPRSRKRDS